MSIVISKTHSERTHFNRKAQVALARSRVTKYGENPTYWTVAAWEATLSYFGYACAYCGLKESCDRRTYLVIEHFYPARLGGKTKLGNCVPSCIKCNSSKGDKLPQEWLGWHRYNAIDAQLTQLCAIHRIKRGEPTEQP